MLKITKLKRESINETLDVVFRSPPATDKLALMLAFMVNGSTSHLERIEQPFQKILPARQASRNIRLHKKRVALAESLLKNLGYESI